MDFQVRPGRTGSPSYFEELIRRGNKTRPRAIARRFVVAGGVEMAARVPIFGRGTGYFLATVFTSLAVLLRWLLPTALAGTPYLAFYPAVVAAAAFGGFGPGTLATVGSFLCVETPRNLALPSFLAFSRSKLT